MPRLRFTRDERGYENTFLVHTTRRRGRERTRILYWFRSPPHVKVGRAAFDEEAIRALEDAHPELAFEWAAILEARPPEPAPEEGERFRRGRGSRPKPSRGGGAPALVRTGAPSELPRMVDDRAEAGVERQPASVAVSVPEPQPEDLDGREPAETAEASGAYGPSAAEQALGPEGLSRVRARYAEVLARIANRVTDAASADKLRETAEGLNPDAWVTAEEVAAGLEHFERVLEHIRQQIGQHRADRRSMPPAEADRRADAEDAHGPSAEPSGD